MILVIQMVSKRETYREAGKLDGVSVTKQDEVGTGRNEKVR